MASLESHPGTLEKVDIDELIRKAKNEIHDDLDSKFKKGEIWGPIYEAARENVTTNIEEWLKNVDINRLDPNVRIGIKNAIEEKRWEHLIEAFLDEIAFGTGGIRGMAAFTEQELSLFAKKGIDVDILKGPNTINNIVLLQKSAGVANYAKDKNLKSIIIGYDSRIQGKAFAKLVAKTFLARGLKVYLFDEAVPYPELTFAVPHLKADLGILISASHNDKRYNGYKLTSSTGAQFDIEERNVILEKYIKTASFSEIELAEFEDVEHGQLVFLGGEKPLDDVNYYGREQELVDMHKQHINHTKDFILDEQLLKDWASQVSVGYSAYHGVGYKAVPKLLKDFGFENLKNIHSLHELNGLFPCFLLEQQPDPGDQIAAEIAVSEFKKEYGKESFNNLDIVIGTDPDADRTGIIIKIPNEQQKVYKTILKRPEHLKVPGHPERDDFTWLLLDADDAWAILLWYRLQREKELGILDPEKKFIVLSHTTSDAITKVAKKFGLGVIKTWVGFGMISSTISKVWDGDPLQEELQNWEMSDKKFPGQRHPMIYEVNDMNGQRIFNFAGLEQSNGFSILGGRPLSGERLGEKGHVRDKDGTFAAILLAELAAYAKSRNTTILDLIDEHIYLDPDIGCFKTYYEPAPYWGQYEGPTGISKKIRILEKVNNLKKDFDNGKGIHIVDRKVVSIEDFRTGKYDALHRWKEYPDIEDFNGFPDEGIRFYFDDTGLNHLTVRPSGTSQCLRFHVQLKAENVTENNLLDMKVRIDQEAKAIAKWIRTYCGA